MTRDEAICRWRDLTHSTVYTAAQAREQAEAIRRVVEMRREVRGCCGGTGS